MINLIFDNFIRVEHSKHTKLLKKLFTIPNPEFLDLCRMQGVIKKDRPEYMVKRISLGNRWVSEKVYPHLRYYNHTTNYLVIPRGAFFQLKKYCNDNKIRYRIINHRKPVKPLNLKFSGVLDSAKGQLPVKNYSFKNGILKAPTGSGKTVMALYLVAKWQLPFCVLVDTKELLNQWIERITTFLEVPKAKIGRIGAGTVNPQPVTVALMQTLKKHTGLLKQWGLIIVDECEIAACESYTTILNEFHGERVLGLSATPSRKDGLTKVMKWHIGTIKMTIQYKNAERVPGIVFFVGTNYQSKINFQFRNEYSKGINELIENEERNQLIINTALNNIEHFGLHLIMSRSSKHLETLYGMLPDHIKLISKVLIGKVKDKDRVKIVSKMKEGKLKFVLATTNLMKKGFDEELLSVLHLVTPMRDPTQPVGRITRVPKDKEAKEKKTKALIFDYFDRYVNGLRGGASARSKVYRKLKIEKRILS